MTDNRSSADSAAQLLPCPFCGGEANFYENWIDHERKWSVCCGDCTANLDVCEETKPEATMRWNDRTFPPAQPTLEPVAWLYTYYVDGEEITVLCDRNDKGAFPVYAAQPLAAPVETKQDWCEVGADGWLTLKHSSAGTTDAGCGAAVITPWADQYNACWDRDKPDALKSAALKALNYIENTENELGIKLSCGDALREALK